MEWLILIVVGFLIYAFTLAPVFPPGWRPFGQALAGLLVVVGLIVLVVALLAGLDGEGLRLD